MSKVNYGLRLRNVLGIMGMLLPVLSLAFNLGFGRGYNPPGALTSISATYYSITAVLFIGLVFGTGLFLLIYDDYDVKDRVVTIIAGIGAIVLVVFPCALPGARTWNLVMLPQGVTNIVHLASALLFFGSLVFLIGFQFTRTGEAATVQPGSRKWRRNILYRICAAVMLVSLVIGFGGARFLGIPYLVFIGETIALEAHGIAWNTKGGMWLRDL
jgi:hypothetical protein